MQVLQGMVMICVMLGMISCAGKSSCPQYPVPTPGTVTQILDLSYGDRDILGWMEVNANSIPLPIYEKLLKTFSPHPDLEDWMDKQLRLWEKLDKRK